MQLYALLALLTVREGFRDWLLARIQTAHDALGTPAPHRGTAAPGTRHP